jgi:hypothetical protein
MRGVELLSPFIPLIGIVRGGVTTTRRIYQSNLPLKDLPKDGDNDMVSVVSSRPK